MCKFVGAALAAKQSSFYIAAKAAPTVEFRSLFCRSKLFFASLSAKASVVRDLNVLD